MKTKIMEIIKKSYSGFYHIDYYKNIEEAANNIIKLIETENKKTKNN